MRSTKRKRALIAAALPLALASLLAAQGPKPSPPLDDAEKQREEIAKVMGDKLKNAQDLVAALAIENYPMLADRANVLKRIGSSSLARVSPNVEYLKYSAEFTSLAEELERRARARDLNGATLSYIRLTINCVECHKHLRDEHILAPKSEKK